MTYRSDLQIAQQNVMEPVEDIAGKLGIPSDQLELYGKYKAKIPLELIRRDEIRKNKLWL